jgi:hypothetical protein
MMGKTEAGDKVSLSFCLIGLSDYKEVFQLLKTEYNKLTGHDLSPTTIVADLQVHNYGIHKKI